jgi:hypothetical protein
LGSLGDTRKKDFWFEVEDVQLKEEWNPED